MWLAFKALTWKVKAGVVGIALAILLAIVGSTAVISYNKGLNVSRVEIQKYEKNVQRIVAAAAKIQTRVDVKTITKYKDRVNTVERVIYRTQTVVDKSVPEQFKFSRGWVYAYNQSVNGAELDSVLASDKSPAAVSDLRALADTIVPNNGICLANKAQLESLQQWIRDTKAGQDEASR